MSSDRHSDAQQGAHPDEHLVSPSQTEKHGSVPDSINAGPEEKWWTDAEETALRRKLDWNIIPQV